jgi:hypothetical protein
LYPDFSREDSVLMSENRLKPLLQDEFSDFPLHPAIVSGSLLFAGSWVFFGSLDAEAVLRKPLWPCFECPVVLLSDFGGKTVLSITTPLLCH